MIAGDRYKTGVSHSVPLSGPAWDALKDAPRWRSGWVFSFDGDGPFRSFGRLKRRLDAAAVKVDLNGLY